MGIHPDSGEECLVPLLSADGGPLKVYGRVQLEFMIDRHVFVHSFVIADLPDMFGILGIDFLEDNDMSIRISRKQLEFNGNVIKLVKISGDGCARIKVAKHVVIPPNSQMIVKGYVDGESTFQEGLVEPVQNVASMGLLCARAIVDTESKDIGLSVLNLSDRSVPLQQHSPLGVLQPIQAIHSLDATLERSESNIELPDHLQPLIDQASKNLDPSQTEQLTKLVSKYQSVFMGPDGNLGRTNLAKHYIDTENARPIKIPPRRQSQTQRDIVERELDKMLSQDIIEPSYSPWSSPVLLVTKKDGSIRFCIDYRKLNTVTRKDAYPLPSVCDSLEALSGSKWFSTLDMASGFWQCELAESDKPKTAFSTHKGLFQFKVLPFGLCNAPSCFERLMEMVLRGMLWESCLCYIDDIIVFGPTFDTALRNLEMCFQRFQSANLKLKPKKCSLFQTEVLFLGHRVSQEGISGDPSKIESVRTWPVPTNVSELRSFLGLIGYYRRFVPNFSTVASPLTRLTQKSVQFEWSQECNDAFESLKERLVSAPILSYPKGDGLFILDTDASLSGVGAVLSQIQDNEEKVIAYASKTLNKSQRNYCTTYRELLAVVTFVKHFRHYLWGRNFKVRTDHSSLIWLKQFKNPEGMLARWLSNLDTYDFTLEHRKGCFHGNADSLSRKPRHCKREDCPECVENQVASVVDFQGNALTWTKVGNKVLISNLFPTPQICIIGTPDCPYLPLGITLVLPIHVKMTDKIRTPCLIYKQSPTG